jgi:hypothetical protein
MTIFPPGAGQAPDQGAAPAESDCVSTTKGQPFDLIIHLDRIEDWSPQHERTPSSDSSDSMEYPKIFDFED